MKRQQLAVALFTLASIGVTSAQGQNGAAPLRHDDPKPVAPAATPATPAATNAPAQPAGPPSKIQFDKMVYDFGSTSFVDSVTGTFSFSNAGEGELKVSPPKPSCGCTVASVKPDVLKAGEKGELVFKVNIAAGARGALEKHITVPSNDPQSPSVNLTVKVDVKQLVEGAPMGVSLGQIKQGMTTNASISIHRTDGKKLVISNTHASSALLQTRLEPEGTNGDAAKLIIEVKGEGAPRRFSDSVQIFVEGVPQPVATVSAGGQLLGDLTLDQEALFWPIMAPAVGSAAAAPPPTRHITVSSTRDDHPLEIKNLTTSLPDLSLELVTTEAKKKYDVVAKLSETPKESTRGTITFDTNSPLQPKITIPVTITVLAH